MSSCESSASGRPEEFALENGDLRKRVTFSQEDPTVYSSVSPSEDVVSAATHSSTTPPPRPDPPNRLPLRLPKLRPARSDETTFMGSFLSISPGEELAFLQNDGVRDATGVILLTNPTTERRTAYKVKTTSPEKYRVRPSTGIIKPGQGAEVTVFLTQGHTAVNKDKFLVMAMEIEDGFISSGELAELWKTTPKTSILEHRLRCSLSSSLVPKEVDQAAVEAAASQRAAEMDKQIAYLGQKLDTVLSSNYDLERRIRRVYRVQIFSTVLLVLFAIVVVLVMYYRLTSMQQWVRNRTSPCSWCFNH